MEVSHNFRFRWNDHVPHLSQIFSELRFEEVYCDTTLISDDGFVLKAHGAVLSTTSRYFERVLCDVSADQHPIIVLKGANFTELSCLLDYIYQGVTQVDQHLMESVLDVADMLEIKGLSKMKNNLSIKKLIAPSPPSSNVSRGSPPRSSPSRSPSPPPHSHSLSCPSSPNEGYASSTMLKVDAEELTELADLTQKNKHTFHDGKSSMRQMECKDYSANTSKYSTCQQSTEFLDQTLGIDLSLSRATNEDNDRTSSKNFILYEDTPQRKRKIMKSEELNTHISELEWGKVGDKTEELMTHKKKKLFTRSDHKPKEDYYEPYPPLRSSSAGGDTSKGLGTPSSELRELAETWGMWETGEPEAIDFTPKSECVRTGREDEPVVKPDLDDEEGFMSEFSENYDNEGAPLLETVRSINQNPYLLAAQIAIQKSAGKSRRLSSLEDYRNASEFHVSNPVSRPKERRCKSALNLMHPWIETKPLVKKEPFRGSDEGEIDHRAVSIGSTTHPSKDLKNFVSVRLFEPGGPSNKSQMTGADRVTAKAFRDINLTKSLKRPHQKIKRPLSKYNLFLKENFHSVASQNPDKKSCEIVTILSRMWQELPQDEKQLWDDRASRDQSEFRARHPNYVFNPQRIKEEYEKFDQRKAEKYNLFRIQTSQLNPNPKY